MAPHAAAAFDPDTFQLRPRGATLEDFWVGRRLPHRGGRTLTQADNLLFSSATCHWSPLYFNRIAAEEAGHPTTVINPYLVLATAIGLSVEDLSEGGGPFLGISRCEFLEPVYPEDTIRAESTVSDCRLSKSRPGMTVVTWNTRVYNQRDTLVIDCVRSNLFVGPNEHPAR
jgi:itaconyl-CoA hydratase